MSVTCDVLQRVPFLRTLDPRGIESIARRLPERRVPAGYTIFRENEECAGFWIVEQGSARVERMSADGRVQILETCEAGDPLGLAAAIEGRAFGSSAIAREPSVLAFFPRQELLAAMRAAPGFAVAVSVALAERLRGLEGRVVSVALQGVRGRVAAHLASEATQRGVRRADGAIDLRLRARQEEIARQIGTVREVVARAFRSLREEGVIEQQRDLVRVRDLGALRRAADT
jgi:CRP/FNR family transcriptional regulator